MVDPAGDANTVSLTRLIRAPRLRDFQAWTDADQLVEWWGLTHDGFPNTEVTAFHEWGRSMSFDRLDASVVQEAAG